MLSHSKHSRLVSCVLKFFLALCVMSLYRLNIDRSSADMLVVNKQKNTACVYVSRLVFDPTSGFFLH